MLKKMTISVRVHKHTFISFINLRRNMIIPIRLFPNHHLFDVHYSLPDPEEDPKRSINNKLFWGWLDHYERSCREDKEAVSFREGIAHLRSFVSISGIFPSHLCVIVPFPFCHLKSYLLNKKIVSNGLLTWQNVVLDSFN